MKKYILPVLFSLVFLNLAVSQQVQRSPIVQDSLKQKKINMPKFPGDMAGLVNYLSQNLRYPKEALKDSISGRVILRFTVGKEGSITNVQVFKSLSPVCDDEAIRVVRSMPRWEPGTLEGKTISVVYTLPITFSAK